MRWHDPSGCSDADECPGKKVNKWDRGGCLCFRSGKKKFTVFLPCLSVLVLSPSRAENIRERVITYTTQLPAGGDYRLGEVRLVLRDY